MTGTAGSKYYRESVNGTGAWDWGAWFSTTGDGVIQGSSDTVSDITMKVVEHNLVTAAMPTRAQIGAALNLNSSAINTITTETDKFEHDYVTGQTSDYDSFLNRWKTTFKGEQLMKDAEAQFIELGLLTNKES